MPVESLENRHILILGASSGMGYATAAYLARAKSVVTITGRNPEKLAAAHKRLVSETGVNPNHVRSTAIDACKAADVEAAVAHAASASGQLDGVFVVAGGGRYTPVLENTVEIVAEQYAINVFPLVNAINSAVPRMKKAGGSIVALSSAAAVLSYPRMTAYGAAKAGLEHYMRVAADELGQYKIRVNAVRSGFTKSGGTDRLMDDQAYLRGFVALTPLGEAYGQAEDFGPMIGLLLSPDTRWITGQVFAIDGGLTLRGYAGGVFPSGT